MDLVHYTSRRSVIIWAQVQHVRVSLLPVASALSVGACSENHTKHDAVRSARASSTILDDAVLHTKHDAVRSARASSTIFDDAMLQAARRPQGMWRQEAPAPRRCSGRMPFVRGAARAAGGRGGG